MHDSHSGKGVSPSADYHKGLLDISSSSEEGVEGLLVLDSELEMEPHSHMEDEKTKLLDMLGNTLSKNRLAKI